jgi:hypothetical protein
MNVYFEREKEILKKKKMYWREKFYYFLYVW